MIRHVVLWRLASKDGDVDAAMSTIRSALSSQQGPIPGLLRVEVGRNIVTSRRAADFALICDFESHDALLAYHKHPAHLATRALVDPLIVDHWIVDYEL